MMPLSDGVSIPFFTKYINNDKFTPEETVLKSADVMLKELEKWSEALKSMRVKE